MKLSIVIPCYNEVDTIESILKTVKDCPVQSKEIIILGAQDKISDENRSV
jgi:glycosyltransferase involved in cell wall biosynthesis